MIFAQGQKGVKMGDYISKEAAIKWLEELADFTRDQEVCPKSWAEAYSELSGIIKDFPAADVAEVIRCKDCRWWDKRDDVMGYCMAAKHGYWSKHWEITIYRTYDGDFYCADAERRNNEAD